MNQIDQFITHLGAEHNVTGSCHLLQVNGLNIMVDCGIAQGKDHVIPMDAWPVSPSRVNYLFLTHAHIDHIGRVPELVQRGFKGEIIATHATKALLEPMLQDAMSFSDMTEDQASKILETIDDLSWGFEYDQYFDLKSGIKFKLGRAGHILGSCFIRFEIPNDSSEIRNPFPVISTVPSVISSKARNLPINHSKSKTQNSFSIVFSGDLGASNTPILPDPDIPEPCDLLIMESTYGDRYHEDRKQRTKRLGEILTRALSDGGKVFIPAFSLGRTQELIYEIDRLVGASLLAKERGLTSTRRSVGPLCPTENKYQGLTPGIPETSEPPVISNECEKSFNSTSEIPVFIDSPLGLKITKIYSSLSEYWDREAKEILRNGDHPIDFDDLYAVENHKDHLRLMEIPGPAVIIAGSGMCTGGRIIDHLKAGLEDPKNDVFFVGYQASGTPGRDIIKYSKRPGGYVNLNGEKIFIRAGIHTLTGYSAHADQNDLIEWVQSMPEKPGRIKLVHGEPEAQQTLKNRLLHLGYVV